MSRVSNRDNKLAALKILTDSLAVNMHTFFLYVDINISLGRVIQKDKTSVVSNTVILILVDKGYLQVGG